MCCGRAAGGARPSRSCEMSSVIAAAAAARRDEAVHGLQGMQQGLHLHLLRAHLQNGNARWEQQGSE